MKKITLLSILIISAFSCQSEEDKRLLYESQLAFDRSEYNIERSLYIINIDSFKVVYEKHRFDDPKAALDFANRYEKYSINLLKKRKESESAKNVLDAERRQREIKKEAVDRKVWENSKYGKLQKKHPEWSDEDCIRVVKKEIWIGMSLDMLKYQRGLPDTANPSNYGNGTEWQWCWDDYTPSCFYGKDGVITAYN